MSWLGRQPPQGALSQAVPWRSTTPVLLTGGLWLTRPPGLGGMELDLTKPPSSHGRGCRPVRAGAPPADQASGQADEGRGRRGRLFCPCCHKNSPMPGILREPQGVEGSSSKRLPAPGAKPAGGASLPPSSSPPWWSCCFCTAGGSPEHSPSAQQAHLSGRSFQSKPWPPGPTPLMGSLPLQVDL